MRIVTQEEMKEIENETFERYRLSESHIVENVGIEIARELEQHISGDRENNQYVFLIGKGNNGADGMAVARNLANSGLGVRAFLLFPEQECSQELKKQVEIANAFGVKMNVLDNIEALSSYFYQTNARFVVVDAIFGTGVRLPLPNYVYDIIKFVNENAQEVLSIDIASGVQGNTGHVEGNAIKADRTYCVGFPKLGCFLSSGAQYSGEIKFINAGFPAAFAQMGDKFQIEISDLVEIALHRNRFADKKIFGHSMVIGGSHGLTGALVLASQAALKVGTGLVTGATWEAQYSEYIARLIPEIMTGYIPADEQKWKRLIENFPKYNSMVIGPGFGVSARSRRAVLTILTHFDGPVVVDADGINVLNQTEDSHLLKNRNAPTILTPHFGEFARLMNVSVEEVSNNTVELLKDAVEQFNAAVILKGPCTFVAFPSGKIYLNLFPNDGMATGGAGDVLAGILGGLLSQHIKLRQRISFYEKVVSIDKTILLGVFIHSRAGHFAAQNFGERAMTASSIIDGLADAFDEIELLADRESNK